MLLLFTFSITPKKILHDVFANHRDTVNNLSSHSKVPLIVNPGINCPCDNLVAESPFTGEAPAFSLSVPFSFAVQPILFTNSFHSTNQFFLNYGLIRRFLPLLGF